MEELKSKLEDMGDHAGDYLETLVDLSSVVAVEKTAQYGSILTSFILSATLICFTVLLSAFSLGFWIGSLLHNLATGFIIVAGFFMLLFGVFAISKRKVFEPFMKDYIVRKCHE